MGIPICITLAQIATIKRLISRLVATSEGRRRTGGPPEPQEEEAARSASRTATWQDNS
ncbi:hypothetical protein L914_02572 [Phytophthora nicotianae]|uniref:Uncharacterized protein n=1 Tax=Phytophthora nicotianae TaxID=4792 RepID=W2NZN6_PHYNI|nr:hypothetical protein L916_02550 [Phytophthora nicotianae]ETM54021.1 hypothetical protein L914_02572 [Phytophthora nicotianae]